MANYMKEVAKLLGMELDEEFRIKNHWGENLVKITAEKGLMHYGEHLKRWMEVGTNGLNDILLGKYEIEKLQFEPKMDENYWTYSHDDFEVFQSYWLDSAIDYARKKCGMMFRTKEEAERERPRVYKELTGREYDEIYDY